MALQLRPQHHHQPVDTELTFTTLPSALFRVAGGQLILASEANCNFDRLLRTYFSPAPHYLILSPSSLAILNSTTLPTPFGWILPDAAGTIMVTEPWYLAV